MIRINLLGAERQSARKVPLVDLAQRVTVLCALVVVIAGAVIGWWYWSLRSASAAVDGEIASAQQESARLRTVLGEVQKFEDRRAQLQQRVALIEQLRSGQSIPVQVLDHVSRSLPETLWLTGMTQEGNLLTLEGRSTTLIALSDFVGNLGSTALLQKPIEIISSQVEGDNARSRSAVELIRFAVKARVTPPPEHTVPGLKAEPAKKRGARAAKAARS
jgi:type IV pilus assembly protein PilN